MAPQLLGIAPSTSYAGGEIKMKKHLHRLPAASSAPPAKPLGEWGCHARRAHMAPIEELESFSLAE